MEHFFEMLSVVQIKATGMMYASLNLYLMAAASAVYAITGIRHFRGIAEASFVGFVVFGIFVWRWF